MLKRRRGLNTATASLIILVVSVLLAAVVMFYSVNVAITSAEEIVTGNKTTQI